MRQHPFRLLEPTDFPFTEHERARQFVYRAAIIAGLYSDAETRTSDDARPFTEPELSRLAMYRAAIQAGFYTDSRAE
jgi:hypothetical protein